MRQLAVDAVIWGFGLLPSGVCVRLGYLFGFVFRYIWRFRRRAIRDQLREALPEFTDTERRHLEQGLYQHLGLLVCELLRQPTLTRKELLDICSVSGLEHIVSAHARGNGVFVLAGHYGNWELGLARAGQLGYPSYAVVKELKGTAGQHIARRLRETHGIGMIPRRQSIREIREALREGALIGFVLDQNMTADEGVFVDFFGKPACTMSSLAVMASRYDVPVVPIRIYRDADHLHHHVEFLPEIPWESPPPGSEESVTLYNTRRYTAVIEEIIRAHPEQWLWIHHRWKTQPSQSPADEHA